MKSPIYVHDQVSSRQEVAIFKDMHVSRRPGGILFARLMIGCQIDDTCVRIKMDVSTCDMLQPEPPTTTTRTSHPLHVHQKKAVLSPSTPPFASLLSYACVHLRLTIFILMLDCLNMPFRAVVP